MISNRKMSVTKRISLFLVLTMLLALLPGCQFAIADKEPLVEISENTILKYHFADKDEAVSKYLSNDEYFNGFSEYDIQYRTQDKNGTLDEVKEYGATQMEEFTDKEKEKLSEALLQMESELISNGYTIPTTDEITFIKSTQDEECGSAAYTHGTDIYLGQTIVTMATSEEQNQYNYGKSILWHEIFHCLTRNNPEFRKDMYSIINFTVQDEEYELPPSVSEKFISNPDVEHHNSYATFDINGEKIDCFVALIATEPFEEKGDKFFDVMATAIIPVDGSDKYYLQEDASNFWDIFGKNTDYVIDPEECMADNFSFALAYGKDGKEYNNPEIIEAIIDYLKK